MLNGAERVAPQNLEAETAVIGAIFIDPDRIDEIRAIVGPEHFYRDTHTKIFAGMIELSDRREPIDVITLSDLLRTKNELESVGGSAYLAECVESVGTAVNVAYYAKIVRREYQARELAKLLNHALDRVSSEDPLLITSEIVSELLRINPTQSNVFPIDKLVAECVKDLEKAYESHGRMLGIPTGLHGLESRFGGLSRGDLVVLGARTSQGKTSLAGTIAKNAAALGYPVAFVSAESDPKKILLRYFSSETQIENVRLQVGMLRDSDFPKITAAAARLANLPMIFIGGVRSLERIKVLLRAIYLREPNLAMVIMDYAQLLDAPVAEKKRYLEISKISADAKGLAVEFNAAVVLLSQLSRDVEKNTAPGQQGKARRPRLSDLRESGSLEQDADLVFLLHRDQNASNEPTELIVAKNREGRIGSVNLRFNEKTVSFEDGEE